MVAYHHSCAGGKIGDFAIRRRPRYWS